MIIVALSVFTLSVGYLAAGLTVSRTVPQVWRVIRVSDEGVSTATWLITFFGNLTWFAFGVFNHVPAETYANLPCFLLAGATFLVVHARRNTLVRGLLLSLLAVAGTTLAVIVSKLAGHMVILSVVAVSCAFVMFLPQAFDAVTSKDLTGISITAWSLGMATATMWGVFGVLAHQPPIYAPVIVQLPACTTVVVRTVMNRKKVAGLRAS